MPSYLLTAYLNTTKEVDILNATHDVKRAHRESKIVNGLLTVYLPGACAGVVVLENEPEVQKKFLNLISSFTPNSTEARPKRRSGTGHSEAHLRGGLLSNSVGIPIKDGKLLLGPWQEVVLYDFDDRIGRRDFHVFVMGDEAEQKK